MQWTFNFVVFLSFMNKKHITDSAPQMIFEGRHSAALIKQIVPVAAIER